MGFIPFRVKVDTLLDGGWVIHYTKKSVSKSYGPESARLSSVSVLTFYIVTETMIIDMGIIARA